MKRIRYRMKYLFALAAACAVSAGATAQQPSTSPAALERYRLTSLWMQSPNAAGSMLDAVREYATFEAGYRSLSGDFHRPQEGNCDNRLNVYTEGAAVLPGFYAWGSFEYTRDRIEGANYNMSIRDPYRGMPYYTMDVVPSPWRNQEFSMRFRLATPKYLRRIAFGIEGSYAAGSATKQQDLRTKDFTMKLELKPGFVFDRCGHSFGLTFNYLMWREDVDNDRVGSESMLYYILKGLGVATYNVGTRRELNYVGNSVGGSFQYAYAGPEVGLLLNLGYDYRVEDVENGFTEPGKEGTVRDTRYGGKVSLRTKGRVSHHLGAGYWMRSIDGIEYIQQRDPELGWQTLLSSVKSTYDTQTGELDYSLLVNRGDEYTWRADLTARYVRQDDRYLLPESLFNYENLSFGLDVRKNLFLGEAYANRLLVSLGGGYNKNLSGRYVYNGIRPDTEPVTGLMAEEIAYLTTDHWGVRASAVYSQRLKRDWRASLFVKAEFSYVKSQSDRYDSRTFVRGAVGFNF